MVWVYLVIIACSFLLSLLGTHLACRISRRIGFLDHPEERKIHRHPIPLGGGVAIYLAVVITIGLGFFAAFSLRQAGSPAWVPETLADNLAGIQSVMPKALLILVASFLLLVMGLIDDRLGIHPKAKLLCQIGVATLLVFAGIRATIFYASPILSGLITVGWMVLITNSFNLLDNMDGLASGVAAIIATIFLIVAIQTGQVFVASLLLTLIGALLGFLIFNFPPAKIFMGDAGSLFVGFFLSVVTVFFTFTEKKLFTENLLFPILMPLIIFLVPLYDTGSVIVIRIRQGRSIFQADRSHFSHRLVDLGMTPREAVLIIYLVTFALSLAATVLYFLKLGPSLIILIQSAAMMSLIALLERAGKRRGAP